MTARNVGIRSGGLGLFQPKTILALFKTAYGAWNEDDGFRLSAALAYYTTFSLAPLLIIFISISGLVFGKAAAEKAIVGEIQGLIGPGSDKTIQAIFAAADRPRTSALVSILGVISLLIGASGVFGELQDALNHIWKVNTRARGTVWRFIRERFISFGMVLSVGFLLLISLIVSAALTNAERYERALPLPAFLIHIVEFVSSFAVITILFALMYKVLPDAKIAWSNMWFAAATTSFLFTVGKFLIGFYIGKSVSASTYGAAGSLVILVAWVYYSAQIFYFGAELARAFATRRDSLPSVADRSIS